MVREGNSNLQPVPFGQLGHTPSVITVREITTYLFFRFRVFPRYGRRYNLASPCSQGTIHDAASRYGEAIEAVSALPAYALPHGAMGEKDPWEGSLLRAVVLARKLPWNGTLRVQRIVTQDEILRYLQTASRSRI